jgi:hypothetical protein
VTSRTRAFGSACAVALLSLAITGAALSHDDPAPTRVRAKPARAVRVQLLGHLNPGGGYSGDVVAHRGYAYLSSYRGRSCPGLGVRVIDVRNPRRAVQVAAFGDAGDEPAVAGTWTEKTIVRRMQTAQFTGDLAVTTFQACPERRPTFYGFGLYDVSNPAEPRRLALVHTEPRGSHEIWLASARGGAWVYTAIPFSELLSSPEYPERMNNAAVPGLPDFRIFDVSDPAHPVQVGEWGAWKELGIHPAAGRGRFLATNFTHSVITNAAATRAYLSYWDLGTVILDVSTPSRPRYLGRTPAVDDEGNAHSAWLARGGRVLVETHEHGLGRPYLFDVSNPARPRLLSRFGPRSRGGDPTSFTNGVHDPKVVGNRVFLSWYSRGVVVASIANARRPRVIGRFVPPPTRDPEEQLCGSGGRCALVWGVYATPTYVLASDMIGGLWIFRLR